MNISNKEDFRRFILETYNPDHRNYYAIKILSDRPNLPIVIKVLVYSSVIDIYMFGLSKPRSEDDWEDCYPMTVEKLNLSV